MKDLFTCGIAIGIIIGLFIYNYMAKIPQTSNLTTLLTSNLRKMDIIEASLAECLQCLNKEDPRTSQVKYHILTNHLLLLDQIQDPELKPLRKATINYVQSIQDHLQRDFQ